MTRTVRAFCLAVILTSLCSPVVAQDPETKLALDLVLNILNGFPFGGDDPPEVLIGRLPAGLAETLHLPEPASVVGSVSYDRHGFSVVAFPPGPEAQPEGWVRALETEGWLRDPNEEVPGFQFGAIRQSFKLCQGDSLSVMMGPSEDSSGETQVHVFHVRAPHYTGCPPLPSGSRPRSPIPPLAPPEDAAVQRGGGSGGTSDQRYSSMVLVSRLGLVELVEHYAGQLRNAGWEVGAVVEIPRLAFAAVELRGSDGESWYGVITAGASPRPDEQTVFILVNRTTTNR